MKKGVLLESFRKPFRESVKEAAALGLDGVQIFAKSDAVHDGMTATEVKEVKRILDGEGLEVSALCGDFGCRMYYYPNEMREEIEREKRILDLAKELGTNIVTTHIGVVPEDFNTEEYENMAKVCRELAGFADSLDGHFAVETGPEPSARLKRFLDMLESRGVGVNLDPANLVMVSADDPVEAVYNLKDYIVHTHAKDGILLKKIDARRIYLPTVTHVDPANFDECFKELPLGEGNVPWKHYLSALKAIGYDGYLTIEREVGENPEKDISAAVKFLGELI